MDEVPAELPRIKAMLDAALAAPGGSAAAAPTASPPSTAASVAGTAPRPPATAQTAAAPPASVPISVSAAAANPAGGAPIAAPPAAAAAPDQPVAAVTQPAAAVPPAAGSGGSHSDTHALTQLISVVIQLVHRARIPSTRVSFRSHTQAAGIMRASGRFQTADVHPSSQVVPRTLRRSARSSCLPCWRRCCAQEPVRTVVRPQPQRQRGVPCTAVPPAVAQRPRQVSMPSSITRRIRAHRQSGVEAATSAAEVCVPCCATVPKCVPP